MNRQFPLLLIAAACLTATASAAPLYSVNDLGYGTAFAVNAKGAAAGYGSSPLARPTVFRNGRQHVLPDLGRGGIAYGLNDRGAAVGEAFGKDSVVHPALWTPDGVFHDLGVEDGVDATAYWIGNDGTIFGDSVVDNRLHAFVIDPDGTRHPFPFMAAGNSSAPSGANSKGQMVGSANVVPDGPLHCFVYADGVFQESSASMPAWIATARTSTTRDTSSARRPPASSHIAPSSGATAT